MTDPTPRPDTPTRTARAGVSSPTAARVVFLTALLAVGACGPGDSDMRQADTPDEPPAAVSSASTASDALGPSYVAEPMAGVVTAAQPTPEQAAALRDIGYENFVSLRPRDEPGAGWEESEFAEAEARFARIPISGADDLTRANVEALDRILDEAGEGRTLLYCASSNRVGALLALRAYWMDGASAEEALDLGREAGMTRLEPAVRGLLAEGR